MRSASCIGMAVYDPAAAVGGLLHYMLPDSAIDPAHGSGNPYMFADTGIPLLLDRSAREGRIAAAWWCGLPAAPR